MQKSLTGGGDEERYIRADSQVLSYVEVVGIISEYCDGCGRERECEVNRQLRDSAGLKQSFQEESIVRRELLPGIEGEGLPERLIVCSSFNPK